MWKALEVWPHLRTLRLLILTLYLWFFGIGLALAYGVLVLIALVTPETAPAQVNALPPLIKNGLGQVLGIVFGVVIGLMFKKSLIYAYCELRVKPLLGSIADPEMRKSLQQAESFRLQGNCTTWRQTMNALALNLSMARNSQRSARAHDAAQRLSPALFCALLLCLSLLSVPFWWTPLAGLLHMPVANLVFGLVCSWALAGVVTGCIASLGVGGWLR